MVRFVARARRALLPSVAALTTLAVVTAPALAASSQPAAVGASSLSGALNGIQSLLTRLALPAAGVGLAGGGVWHSVAHDQRSQEGAKSLMKSSLIGAGVVLVATAMLHAFAGAL